MGKKAQVREQVKKWVLMRPQTVLTKTKQYYHEVHLPRILQKSEEYFVYLTGGRYSKNLFTVRVRAVYCRA